MAQGWGGPWPRDSGPSGRAGRRAQRTRVVTTTAADATVWVPLMDRWPRVAVAVDQAPGGLRESVGQRFEDGGSPGRCGTGGATEAGRNDGTRRQ
jgi:hypothetical protein